LDTSNSCPRLQRGHDGQFPLPTALLTYATVACDVLVESWSRGVPQLAYRPRFDATSVQRTPVLSNPKGLPDVGISVAQQTGVAEQGRPRRVGSQLIPTRVSRSGSGRPNPARMDSSCWSRFSSCDRIGHANAQQHDTKDWKEGSRTGDTSWQHRTGISWQLRGEMVI